MRYMAGLLLFCSVAAAAALRQMEPSFKREVVERYPTGSDKHLLIAQPTKAGSAVVQEWELYPSGAVAWVFDVQAKEDGMRVRSGACLQYAEDGKLLAHYNYVEDKLDGEQLIYNANGAVFSRTEYHAGIQEGKRLVYYPSGELKEEANFSDGKCIGKAFGYFSNGAVQKQITFVDGVREGMSELFDEEGRLLMREHYAKGKLETTGKCHAVEKYDVEGQLLFIQDFQAGEPHGLCMQYNSAGNLLYIVEYASGKMEGKEEFFAENGMSLGSGLYVHGVPVGTHLRKYPSGQVAYIGKFDATGLSKEPVREYFDDGSLYKEYVLSPKGLEGEYKEYDRSGALRVCRHFVGGALDGLQEIFFVDGNKALEAHFVEGKEQGVLRRWHESGALAAKESYTAGLLDGAVERFYANGMVQEQSDWKEGQLNGVLKIYAECGQLIEERAFIDGVPSGLHKMYDTDGGKRLEARFAGGKVDGPYFEWAPGEQLIKSHYFVDGVAHGEQKTYFPGEERRLARIATFEHGSPIGDHKAWHENGRLSELCTYNHAGQLEGKSVRFNADGLLIEEAEYENGKLNGLFRQIDLHSGREVVFRYKEDLKHGRHEVRYPKKHALVGAQIAYFADYEEDEIHGFEKSFTEEGQLLSSIPYVRGKREGIAESFTKRGEKRAQIPYENGLREGVALEFYPSGTTKLEVTFIADKREGPEKRYFTSGNLASERHYKEGLLDGCLREWSENATLLCEANYAKGKREGLFRKFYADGKPRVEQTFVGDKLDGVKKSYDVKGRVTKTNWELGEQK